MTRHFLSLMDLAPAELAAVLARAIELKAMLRRGEVYEPLRNKILAMIFGPHVFNPAHISFARIEWPCVR